MSGERIARPQIIPLRAMENAFEAFCEEHQVSGLLIWADADSPPGARPKTGSHLAIAALSDPAHGTSFRAATGAKLIDFRQWLRGLMAAR